MSVLDRDQEILYRFQVFPSQSQPLVWTGLKNVRLQYRVLHTQRESERERDRAREGPSLSLGDDDRKVKQV